jgi:uncharacterized protein YjbJ (UPF0337 family)
MGKFQVKGNPKSIVGKAHQRIGQSTGEPSQAIEVVGDMDTGTAKGVREIKRAAKDMVDRSGTTKKHSGK